MRNNNFRRRTLAVLLSGLMITAVCAGEPLWKFKALTATTIAVPANGTALVQYEVTNQSPKPHLLVMRAVRGIEQITTGLGSCGNPFMLSSKQVCTLSLRITGGQLNEPIANGPVVCERGNSNQCYHPDDKHILRITQTPAILDTIITATGSPLTLTVNGATGQLTINNTSTQVAATNITSNFTGTALNGNVTETGNTCANVAPSSSCTLTYTPGNTVVPQTNFTIQGTNTNDLTAAIAIQSGSALTSINPVSGAASGETSVTLTGTGLTGATTVTFDGIAATSVNVVNSTTVTAVTPAHAVGTVDIVINTPAGGATLANGYTYLTTAVGQPSGGGIIACLRGGLQNIIATRVDNSTSIVWGGVGIGVGAVSLTDGAANTTAIVSALGNNGGIPYAAQLCNNYEIDSQGNSPCQSGNTCYNDWFLPSGDQAFSLVSQIICLFDNRAAIGGFSVVNYWSSTERTSNSAWSLFFDIGGASNSNKGSSFSVRCVRAFTP